MSDAFKWSDDRRATLERLLLKDGLSLAECAERFGISYHKARSAAGRFGFVSGNKSHASGYWTDERIAAPKSMHRQGLSASQIAAKLRNTSRGAVIGKLHREGLGEAARPKPAKPLRAVPVKRPERIGPPPPRVVTGAFPPTERTAPKPPPIAPSADVARVKPIDLRLCHCRWPVGDVGEPDFGCCGLEALSGPYCPGHAARAYQAPKNPGVAKLARSIRRYV